MSKQFLAVIAIIVVLLGGVLLLTRDDKAAAPTKNSTGATSHIKGDGSSGVTLVEYGDYECPACSSFEPTVEQVYEKYSKEIKFQFRNLPLVSIHQNAFAGARAAEAASLQNKFWEMHDLLYSDRTS